MQSLRQDLLLGIRSLRKEPASAVIASITLALGIGLCTIAFSLVREILRYKPNLELRDSTHNGTALDWALYGTEHGWCRERGDYPATIAELSR